MKKLILLTLILVTAASVSFAAESTDDAIQTQVRGLLTEVYGYLEAEAQAFSIHITEEDDHYWYIQFYLNPDWVYTATIRKNDSRFEGAYTPFSTLNVPKASENSVRQALRAIADNGWFENWNAGGKAALAEHLARYEDIRLNASMQTGLSLDGYTPAQALNDFFFSCYGDSTLWTEELRQWRDAVFFSFGLEREEETFAAPQGIVNRTVNGAEICEFVGEVPDALSQAFAVPRLEGWDCLAGAYRISDRFSMDNTVEGIGLAAFQNGDERLLLMLYLDTKTKTWQVIPVGKGALLPERDLYIVYGSRNNRFDITYPISDTEQEVFQCRLLPTGIVPATNGLLCELMEYRHVSLSENRSVAIAYEFNNPFSCYYAVTTTQNGNKTQVRYPALATSMMDYIDASAFPGTEEACRLAAQESPAVPEGYAVTSNVHLRADTSSHSKDLGMYRKGTLAEVLDIQPGSAYPWFHVRIGHAEGYMSGNYVAYKDNTDTDQQYISSGMAKLKSNTALKEQPSGFAGTVTDLPKGTVVRVLAETGNWLHVSVPQNADDWMMRPGETDGYVKANAVVQAATALQLEWLIPDD